MSYALILKVSHTQLLCHNIRLCSKPDSMLRIVLICFCGQLFAQPGIEKSVKLFKEGKFSEASKGFSVTKKEDADYHQARYYLGMIAFGEKKLDEAQRYFEEAIQAKGNVADYHYWLGSTYGNIARDANVFKQGTLAPKIKNSFETAVKLDPNHLDARWGLIEYYSQAPGFMGGSWEKAEQTARAMIKIKPAEGYRALGNVYSRQEKWGEAEQAYIAMHKADPAYGMALANFYIGRQNHEKAFLLYNEALEEDAENMLLNYQVGRANALSGKYLDKGEACLKKYLQYTPKQNEPSHAGAYMRLGMIEEKRRRKAEAKKHYEKSLQLDGQMKEAKEGLSRVK